MNGHSDTPDVTDQKVFISTALLFSNSNLIILTKTYTLYCIYLLVQILSFKWMDELVLYVFVYIDFATSVSG